jgi:hypothetical protein
MPASAPRHSLYNTTVVLLKFLLAPLAVCVLVLFVQLGVKFPRAFALVDATPRAQMSSDGSFYVAFYGLHLFASYNSLDIKVSVTSGARGEPKQLDRYISPDETKADKKNVFFSERFTLPVEFLQGDYAMAYTVIFHGRRDREEIRKGYTISYRREQACENAVTEGVPVFVRQGQWAPLPKDWARMGLRVVGNNPGVAVETIDGAPRVRISPSLGLPKGQEQAEYLISLQSTLFVTKPGTNSISAKPALADPETKVNYGSNAGFLRRCGSYPYVTQAAIGQRLAFAGPPNAATRVLLTPASYDQTADVTLRLFVERNLPPESVSYDDRLRGVVSLFTSWLFVDQSKEYGNREHQRYFEMNRYVIDPDGRDPATNDPDVRPAEIDPSDAGFFTPWRSTGPGREVRFYLTESGFNQLKSLSAGDSVKMHIVAQDELPRSPLTLVVTKDVW